MKIAIVTSLSGTLFKKKDSKVRNKLGYPPYPKILYTLKNFINVKIPPPVPFLGPVMLGTVLKNHGYNDLHILDFYVNPLESKKILKNIAFDLIVIHSTFLDLKGLIEISKISRLYNSNALLIAGGPEACDSADFLITNKIADYVVIGEGESIILDIVTAIHENKTIDNIPGIYKKESTIQRSLIKNLDSLPFPDWNLINLKNYVPTLPIETMRGCTFSCIYCNESKFWRKPVRRKSKERVVEEISQNIKKYNINIFRFIDSTFNAFTDYSREICELIIKKNLSIKWSCFARAENITEPLVKEMAKSGCIGVFLGAESTSKVILDKMNKNLTTSCIENAINLLKKYNIIAHTSFILGFPGENKNTIQESVDFIKRTKPNTFAFSTLYVSKDTDLYKMRHKYGLTGYADKWKTKNLNAKKCGKILKKIYKKQLANIEESYYCFAGEWVANLLMAIGLTKKEVMETFNYLNMLCKHSHLWILYNGILSKFKSGKLKQFFDILKKISKNKNKNITKQNTGKININ